MATLESGRALVNRCDPTTADQKNKVHAVVPARRRSGIEAEHIGDVPGQTGGFRPQLSRNWPPSSMIRCHRAWFSESDAPKGIGLASPTVDLSVCPKSS
jgi:hypothetical protein